MPNPDSDDDVANIRNAIFAGRKIEAIKLYRAASGESLKEAKDLIEAIEAELRRTEPASFTVPPRGKGCAATSGAFVLVLFLAGLAASAGPLVGAQQNESPKARLLVATVLDTSRFLHQLTPAVTEEQARLRAEGKQRVGDEFWYQADGGCWADLKMSCDRLKERFQGPPWEERATLGGRKLDPSDNLARNRPH